MMSLLFNRRVLIVDDEKSVRDVFARYFRRRGFDVIQAGTVQEALDVLSTSQPQIVLLDIMMPGRNGLDALVELRKLCPSAKVIMITAVRNEEVFHRCMELGASDYIVKPVELCVLDAQVFGKMLC